ncbi:MAG TPA: flagellar hook-basal body complex protein FliE [Steroidobacteraceae bacterium]|nr:flagellar hook-basal body complex protein FliE [Steroidobacteraceae bacterium]
MSEMQINQVLAQIRALSQQVRPPAAGPGAPGGAAGLIGAGQASGPVSGAGGPQAAGEAAGPGGSVFAALLKQGIDQVNQSELRANDLATQFQRGTPGVDLPQVMIEMQKATVSLRALTEVRNRLVSVYQDIMNMQM